MYSTITGHRTNGNLCMSFKLLVLREKGAVDFLRAQRNKILISTQRGGFVTSEEHLNVVSATDPALPLPCSVYSTISITSCPHTYGIVAHLEHALEIVRIQHQCHWALWETQVYGGAISWGAPQVSTQSASPFSIGKLCKNLLFNYSLAFLVTYLQHRSLQKHFPFQSQLICVE